MFDDDGGVGMSARSGSITMYVTQRRAIADTPAAGHKARTVYTVLMLHVAEKIAGTDDSGARRVWGVDLKSRRCGSSRLPGFEQCRTYLPSCHGGEAASMRTPTSPTLEKHSSRIPTRTATGIGVSGVPRLFTIELAEG